MSTPEEERTVAFERSRRIRRVQRLLADLLHPKNIELLSEMPEEDKVRELVARFLCTYLDEELTDDLTEELFQHIGDPALAKVPLGPFRPWVRRKALSEIDESMPEAVLEPILRRLLPDLAAQMPNQELVSFLKP